MFPRRPLKYFNLILGYSLFIALIPAPSFAAGPAITTTTTTTAVNTILSGKTPPTTSIGKNGDFYIDTTNLKFYGPKKNGSWPLGISIKGADGKDGIDGKNGVDGKDGKNGIDGKNGLDGAVGKTGAIGATGATGATGLTGSVGPAGPKGETGAAGLAGVAGAVGAKGEQGIQGVAGAKGDKGDTGLQGEQGLKGDPGVAGAKGDTGLTGATGAKGDKGDVGATGAQGPAGPSETYSNTISFGTDLKGTTPVESNSFANLGASKNFHFELVLTGKTNADTGFYGIEMIVTDAVVKWDYTVAKSVKYEVASAGLAGGYAPGYVFTVIGTISTGTGGSTLKVKVSDPLGMTTSAAMTLYGRSLIIQTETIK